MTVPPNLLPFQGDWPPYEDRVYEAFLDSIVRTEVRFLEMRVSAQFRPETRGKGFSFWHTISEAPSRSNRNEDDRIPDIRRCERILWIRWAIENAGNDGFLWWENQRQGNTHVVIWAVEHDFAVILAKRKDYYVLKTAYTELKPHRKETFRREYEAYCRARKG